nr:glutathione S-transferase T3-like [Setaria viridis]
MQAPRPTAPVRQGQVRRGGGMLQRRVVVVGGQHPQWPGGDHMPQWTGGDHDLDLAGGPPMAALAGDDFNSVSSDPSAAFEQVVNDNSFGNGNGYFSNMMTDETNQGDFHNYSNTYVDQQSQAIEEVPAAPSARPNHKRSKNFSDHEDEVLVSGWLNVSLDPVVGKDQKGAKYWSRIYEYFNEHKTCPSTRTMNSLMHRWETIQKAVNKFCGCLSRIELRRQSGTTIQDKVAEACALYKSEDEHQRAFQFMHCWNKLRTQPKWLAKIDELAVGKTSNKKQKTSSNAGPSASLPSELGEGEVQGIEDNALTRPIGKKKAKAALLQEKKKSVTTTLENMWVQKKEIDGEKELKKEERFNKAFALEQDRVANEKLLIELRSQEVQLQKRRDEERIMTMDLTTMPDEQKKYYMSLRAEIMSRLSMPSA